MLYGEAKNVSVHETSMGRRTHRTPSTQPGDRANQDQPGDRPTEASTAGDLPRPQHHCAPSFRLDCQVIDMMYGAQLVGAQRRNHFDREIKSLNRVADTTDGLKRTFHFRVANSWVGYNQVLLETADWFFGA